MKTKFYIHGHSTDSYQPTAPVYHEQLRINSIAILPDGSRAYAALITTMTIGNNSQTDSPSTDMNSFAAIINLTTVAEPVLYHALQDSAGELLATTYIPSGPSLQQILLLPI